MLLVRTGGRGWWAAVPAGLFPGVGFSPLGGWWAAWVAMTPFLLVPPKLSPRQTLAYGWLVGLSLFCLTQKWLLGVIGPRALAVLVAFRLRMGSGFRVARLIQARLGRRALVRAVPFCFPGQEILRSEGLSRFRFVYADLGYTQMDWLRVDGITSPDGVHLPTFLIVLFNMLLASAVRFRGRGRKTWRMPAAGAAVEKPALVAQLTRSALTDREIPLAAGRTVFVRGGF